jgi:hypothetical protein
LAVRTKAVIGAVAANWRFVRIANLGETADFALAANVRKRECDRSNSGTGRTAGKGRQCRSDPALALLNDQYDLRAYCRTIEYCGHTVRGGYMVMMGTGLGVAYPPIWGGSLHVNRWSDLTIETGMVFYLHSCLQFMDEKIGILQGGTYHVTETGVEMLCGSGDHELLVV